MESSSRHQSCLERLSEHKEDESSEADEECEEVGLGEVLDHEGELVSCGFEDRVAQESLQAQDGDKLGDGDDQSDGGDEATQQGLRCELSVEYERSSTRKKRTRLRTASRNPSRRSPSLHHSISTMRSVNTRRHDSR